MTSPAQPTSKLSPALAAIREAAAPAPEIEAAPPVREKPPLAPIVVRRDESGRGNGFISQLEPLPFLAEFRRTDDAAAVSAVRASLERYETACALIEKAGDVRFAAEAVAGLKALGLEIDDGLESRAWFRPSAEEAAKHRVAGEEYTRAFFLNKLSATLRTEMSRVLRGKAAALRAHFAKARDLDAALRQHARGASAANDDLWVRYEHAIAVLEWEADAEPNLKWHHDVRYMVQGGFSVPL